MDKFVASENWSIGTSLPLMSYDSGTFVFSCGAVSSGSSVSVSVVSELTVSGFAVVSSGSFEEQAAI